MIIIILTHLLLDLTEYLRHQKSDLYSPLQFSATLNLHRVPTHLLSTFKTNSIRISADDDNWWQLVPMIWIGWSHRSDMRLDLQKTLNSFLWEKTKHIQQRNWWQYIKWVINPPFYHRWCLMFSVGKTSRKISSYYSRFSSISHYLWCQRSSTFNAANHQFWT